ncbi:tRNA delta(2)-isopentenylpyrophosphate transferase [Actibacterium mucosum KCTC 23349]|uniref:tRNA dimethylallyltransferase n=1 Tax=Actibacterium mucosum KCTC 23349 TaxID=1454373 RepID=A0A037ZML7_9RHOB|nr:tRNA (adenosine(37)-N6)-dimethylallyltransferase MiaA [Actibacterium mucosum]KAJ56880.1 tRNA delta(2)-isopentenylpyrophosphate transferase [Actibacterium mucosum KCTC 23349]
MKPPFGLNNEQPVLIAGPTASGKSSLALEIAARGGGVIVNADALQVYGNWQILTARPSPADEAAAPHRLYGHVPFDGDYSVGHWLREVGDVMSEGQRPIIVGGTGLYFSALTEGLAEIPPTPADIRNEADARMRDEGALGMLAELDTATTARIDTRNPVRVQRAWEVQKTTGRGLASWQDATPPPLLPLARAQAFVLNGERDWLNARIDRRFDMMINAGALDEVQANLPHWDPARPSSKAIGAPELVAHLQGRLDLPTAINRATIATHQYAKRQRTWFRSRMKSWAPLDPSAL